MVGDSEGPKPYIAPAVALLALALLLGWMFWPAPREETAAASVQPQRVEQPAMVKASPIAPPLAKSESTISLPPSEDPSLAAASAPAESEETAALAAALESKPEQPPAITQPPPRLPPRSSLATRAPGDVRGTLVEAGAQGGVLAVHCVTQESHATSLNPDGTFELTAIPPGNYDIVVATLDERIAVAASCRLPEDPIPPMTLQAASRLRVQILGMSDGKYSIHHPSLCFPVTGSSAGVHLLPPGKCRVILRDAQGNAHERQIMAEAGESHALFDFRKP